MPVSVWMWPSASIRAPSPLARSTSTVPHSSTPARIRDSTCSRLWRSSTTLSMPAWWSMSESSEPAGPAPMIATWVVSLPPASGQYDKHSVC